MLKIDTAAVVKQLFNLQHSLLPHIRTMQLNILWVVHFYMFKSMLIAMHAHLHFLKCIEMLILPNALLHFKSNCVSVYCLQF